MVKETPNKMEQWIRMAVVPILAQLVTAFGVYMGNANSVKTEVAPLQTAIAVINVKVNSLTEDVQRLKDGQDNAASIAARK